MEQDKSVNVSRGELFEQLCEIMDTLRQECPWDKKQTLNSLIKYSVEELYELIDAIEQGNYLELKEELGDVLFHMVFYSRIAQDKSLFDVKQVLESVIHKMKYRHPHIYGDEKVKNATEVERLWQQKKLEQSDVSILAGVPRHMPNVVKAQRIQEKMSAVGFDFPNYSQTYSKVEEEIKEFEQAVSSGNKIEIEKELGDVLFAIINVARKLDIDASAALGKTNNKVIDRFQYIEQKAKDNSQDLNKMTLEEMDKHWGTAKKWHK